MLLARVFYHIASCIEAFAVANNIYFPFETHIEFLQDRVNDLFTQCINLGSRGMAVVHQYKGLFRITTHIALPVSLPAALFDQPSGCKLCKFRTGGISHDA